MKWAAIIPYREVGGKSRLSDLLTPEERRRLSRNMFAHVSAVLAECRDVDDIILLGDAAPDFWTGSFVQDAGRGLNAELADLVEQRPAGPTFIIHSDLPQLEALDVGSLLGLAAESGCALAPDRTAMGTNALALADPAGFTFQFGPGSFALHRASVGHCARTLNRTGLAADIDTPEDYLEACRTAPEIMERMRGVARLTPVRLAHPRW